jgi:iron complex outermembrane receptor protein
MLFCASPFLILAQNKRSEKLQLKVLDSLTLEPLQGATVVLHKHGHAHLTDDQGLVYLDSLIGASVLIHISYIGYHHLDVNLMLPQKEAVTVLLCSENYHLHETLVEAGSMVSSFTKSNKEYLNDKALQNRLSQNLAATLNGINGLSLISSSGNIAKPVIRGLHSQRLVTLQGNSRIEGQQWGEDHGPEVDPFAVQELEVIKGAATVEYGPEAIGGVIRLLPKAWRKEKGIGVTFNLQGMSNNKQGAANIGLEGRKDFKDNSWLAARASGSVRRAGDSRAPDYVISNTGFKEMAAQAGLAYRRNKWFGETNLSYYQTIQGIFVGSHVGNLNDLDNALNATQPLVILPFTYEIGRPYQQVQHALWNTLLQYEPNANQRIQFNYTQQVNRRQEYDAEFVFNPNRRAAPATDLEIQSVSADLILEQKLSHHWKAKFGLSSQWQYNTTAGLQFIIPEFNSFTQGAFALIKKEFISGEVSLGSRFDWRFLDVPSYQRFNKTYGYQSQFKGLSMVFNWLEKLSETLLLNTTLSYGFRPPAVNELYSFGLHYGIASFEIGNANLNPEKSLFGEVSLKKQFTLFTFELTGFARYFEGFIYRRPLPDPILTVRGAFPAFVFTQDNSFMGGAELALNYGTEKGWYGATQFSYLYAQNLSRNEPLIFMPANRMQLHWGYKLIQKNKLSEPFIQLSWNAIAKQNRVPEGVDYAPPPEAYQLFGMSAGFGFKPFEKAKVWSLNMSIQNLLNTAYRDYLSRYRYFTDDTGFNFLIRLQILI